LDSEQRGLAAQRILDEPVFKEMLAGIKEEIIEQWANVPARDQEGREWLWRHYVIAQKIEGILRGYAQTGRFEAAQQQVSFKDRIKRVL